MTNAPKRTMADLSAYPDLVVIFLGMRVEEPRGLATLQKLGPEIQASVEEQPDGLLLHERLTFSTEPLHTGMRQYWRDFEALEAWSLELPHKAWWTDYALDRGGTSFWHETYFRRGGFETIYVDVDEPSASRASRRRRRPRVRCSRPASAATQIARASPRPRDSTTPPDATINTATRNSVRSAGRSRHRGCTSTVKSATFGNEYGIVNSTIGSARAILTRSGHG